MSRRPEEHQEQVPMVSMMELIRQRLIAEQEAKSCRDSTQEDKFPAEETYFGMSESQLHHKHFRAGLSFTKMLPKMDRWDGYLVDSKGRKTEHKVRVYCDNTTIRRTFTSLK